MGLNIISVFAALFGILLMFKALDTLIPWRGWFFLISGLIFFLAGAGWLYLRMRREEGAESEQ
jgi:glucose dehydrogenase